MIIPGVIASSGIGGGSPGPGPDPVDRIFGGSLYSGSASAQDVTGFGFSPDLVLLKQLDSTSLWGWFDKVRGTERYLQSNASSAEIVDAQSVTAFLADGFSLGTAFSGAGTSRVGFGWREQEGAFSITTYTGNGTTGRTLAHNLGVVPEMIIVKSRSLGFVSWPVYLAGIASAESRVTYLNGVGLPQSSSNWNNKLPTSTLVEFGNGSEVNGSGATYVLYA
jgi:hypothetical protein